MNDESVEPAPEPEPTPESVTEPTFSEPEQGSGPSQEETVVSDETTP